MELCHQVSQYGQCRRAEQGSTQGLPDSPSANSRHSRLAWRSASALVAAPKHSQRAKRARCCGPPTTSYRLRATACRERKKRQS